MNLNKLNEKQWIIKANYALIVMLICRLLANYFIPLNEHTESRYGEIARKMLETGNWVTLQHDYGVPFWAKPPLSTWLSALSMKFFGINEFALRLPALLLSMGVLGLIYYFCKKRCDSITAMIAVLVLAGSLYFFIDAGAIMTEPALIFCITLSFVAFWRAVIDNAKSWSYLFFVGLGLGLLAKGPIAVVLVGIPIFFWVVQQNQWSNLWHRLPWVFGTLLTFAIALPWYLLAERQTPGFLNYFILGEHFHRFLTPGWGGDKYGFAHLTPKGIIWVYAFAGFTPWVFVGIVLLKNYQKIPKLMAGKQGFMSYLLFFMLSPLLFFSFASNVIYPYAFPSLPAFALLFATLYSRYKNGELDNSTWICLLAPLSALLVLFITLLFVFKPAWIANTQKSVIQAWLNQKPSPGSALVYWSNGNEFSAQFYSHGAVTFVQNASQLCQATAGHKENYLVIYSKYASLVPQAIFEQFQAVSHIKVRKDDMLLLRAKEIVCANI